MIETTYGCISGLYKDGVTEYLGIPYAKAPVGALAFRHPEAIQPWSGILHADHGSANPVQGKGGFQLQNQSQDCLYMKVFVPDHEPHEKLPVMVWIYGGSYSQGGAGAVEKDSTALAYELALFAKETHTVTVSFNYRLNVFGFLHLHALSDRFASNCGLYDQLEALRFVQRIIAAFDGDPDNVTVFGQSAGGACILALMSMEESRGLFHKAIVQSACIEHFFTSDEARRYTALYMKKAGIQDPEALRIMSNETIARINASYEQAVLLDRDIRCAFSPVIDGITLRHAPKEAVRSSNIPLLIGNTASEANLFIRSIPTAFMPIAAKLIHVSMPDTDTPVRQRLSDALTNHIYVRPQLEILNAYSANAWRYEYAHVTEGSKWGSCHASELPVLFGSLTALDGTPIPSNDTTGAHMRSIWSHFAHTGDPGWSLYTTTKETYRIL